MKAALFHANGRTDRNDEPNSRFSQFCERASRGGIKITVFLFSTGGSQVPIENGQFEVCFNFDTEALQKFYQMPASLGV